MFGCGLDFKDLCNSFACKVEQTDKGLTITLTSDDPQKVKALKAMVESCKELCADNCCS